MAAYLLLFVEFNLCCFGSELYDFFAHLHHFLFIVTDCSIELLLDLFGDLLFELLLESCVEFIDQNIVILYLDFVFV
jgi:hypothetical protein